MGKITRLPARNCVFFKFGRCVYNEAVNPGLDPEIQCRVLLELEYRYDKLLTQADVFDLDSRQVQKIWAGRFGENVSWETCCALYEPRSPEDDRCLRLYGNACVNLFPLCAGVCSSYVMNRREKRY